MLRFAPYVLKSLWGHRIRSGLTLSGAAVALFVYGFVGAVQQGLDDLARRTGLQVSQIEPYRPAVDRLVFPCESCGGTMRRVAPIVDAAFEDALLPWAMASRPGPADLAVGLEPTDPGTMAGSRVDDDEGPLVVVQFDPFGRKDPHEPVVNGTRKIAAVHHLLELVAEDVLDRLRHMLQVLVAALPHDVSEEDIPLPEIGRVLPEGLPRQLWC